MRASFPLRCWLPTIRWRWRNARHYRVRAARWCGYLGSGYDDTEDSSCYIPPLTTIKQIFACWGKPAWTACCNSLRASGEGQSAVARLTGEKKNHPSPNTQTASPQALADSLMQLARKFPDSKAGSERNAINVSQLIIRHPRLYTLCVRLVCCVELERITISHRIQL